MFCFKGENKKVGQKGEGEGGGTDAIRIGGVSLERGREKTGGKGESARS